MKPKPRGRPRVGPGRVVTKSVAMPQADWDRLRDVAFRERCSVSALIRRAVALL